MPPTITPSYIAQMAMSLAPDPPRKIHLVSTRLTRDEMDRLNAFNALLKGNKISQTVSLLIEAGINATLAEMPSELVEEFETYLFHLRDLDEDPPETTQEEEHD